MKVIFVMIRLHLRGYLCICIFTCIFSACTYKECTLCIYIYKYTTCQELFIKGKMERFGSFHPAGGAMIRDLSGVYIFFLFTHNHIFITSQNRH